MSYTCFFLYSWGAARRRPVTLFHIFNFFYSFYYLKQQYWLRIGKHRFIIKRGHPTLALRNINEQNVLFWPRLLLELARRNNRMNVVEILLQDRCLVRTYVFEIIIVLKKTPKERELGRRPTSHLSIFSYGAISTLKTIHQRILPNICTVASLSLFFAIVTLLLRKPPTTMVKFAINLCTISGCRLWSIVYAMTLP